MPEFCPIQLCIVAQSPAIRKEPPLTNVKEIQLLSAHHTSLLPEPSTFRLRLICATTGRNTIIRLMQRLAHALSLYLVLLVLWISLSGEFHWLLLTLGLLSAGLVVVIALRMDVVDHEGHPVHLRPDKLVAYWGWLLWEIVKANVDVSRRIVSPRLPISPTLTRVRTTQSSELGQVMYANSITLTPGTVSMSIDGDSIEVHALTQEAAATLAAGHMDRRVTAVEGGVWRC